VAFQKERLCARQTPPSRFVRCVISLLIVFSVASSLAQQTNAIVTGTVTNATSTPVPNAKITAKNRNTGETTTTQSDASGHFQFGALPLTDYEISVSADGFGPQTSKITLAAGVPQTLNLALTPTKPENNLPNAPSSSKTEPSLSDLGFTPEQTQGNAKEQALLDKRTHMLKVHQKLGLITTAPLIATVVTSLGAGGKHTSNSDRTAHLVLGAVSGDLYFITAYYAIRAPRVPEPKTRGPIRFHKAMAWIHGPGMILTPILGALAYNQKSNGEKVHGIASAHGPVAIVTAGAFGAALLSVSLKF
jgi:Carboxypeptidase regulatory-like domain